VNSNRPFAHLSNEQISFLWSATVNLYNRVIKFTDGEDPGPTILAGKELCRILGREVEERKASGQWGPIDLAKPMEVIQ
jgi:hypothetical protein